MRATSKPFRAKFSPVVSILNVCAQKFGKELSGYDRVRIVQQQSQWGFLHQERTREYNNSSSQRNGPILYLSTVLLLNKLLCHKRGHW